MDYQVDQLYMAVLFRYIVKRDLYSVRYCEVAYTSSGGKTLAYNRSLRHVENVLADIFDYLAHNFDPLAENVDPLADKNVRETFLRGLMIYCTPRFFHRCIQASLFTRYQKKHGFG